MPGGPTGPGWVIFYFDLADSTHIFGRAEPSLPGHSLKAVMGGPGRADPPILPPLAWKETLYYFKRWKSSHG
ncbi:hypothetical protein PanWU01x14_253540, partial [Parasponia andersonii]